MTSNAPTPEVKKTIYDGLDPTQDLSKVNGDPVFGFYPKPAEKTKSFLFEFANRAPGKSREARSKATYPEFDRAITFDDLESLKKAAASLEIGMSSPRLSAAVMSSTKAFTGVTKQVFAKAFVEAIQQPQCAGFYAIIAMSRKLLDVKNSLGIDFVGFELTHPEQPELIRQLHEMSSVAYSLKNVNPSDFMMSGQYFRAGDWESAPLTADEILAMPFVLGEMPEVYAEVEHDLGRHAESCARKLEIAGYPDVASYITNKFEFETVITKPQRKHEDPGFTM